MNTQTLIKKAQKLGISFETRDGQLKVSFPKGPVPEFVEVLRAHKKELLAWFAGIHLAKQVVLGEFRDCDLRTIRKIIATLKNSQHPLALRALETLLHDV